MSEIWISKIKRLFAVLNVNNDGVISKTDFDRLAEGMCAERKDDPAYQEEVRRVMDDLWLRQTGSRKAYERQLMTEAVMVDALLKQRNDPKMKATIREFCGIFFLSIEAKRRGYLRLEENRRALSNFGLTDPRLAEQIFKVADINHDGEMSLEEATRALSEFMLNDGENPKYNLLFGDLVPV